MLSPILELDKVRNAAECIMAFDEKLNVILWNPAAEKRLGILEKDAMGKSFLSLFPRAATDDRTRYLSIAMQMDQPFYFPNRIYLFTPPYTYYSQYIHPLKIDGKTIGVVNIVRDHTMEETFSTEEFHTYFKEEPA